MSAHLLPRKDGEPRKEGAPHAAVRRGCLEDRAYGATRCGGGRARHEESHAGGHCQCYSSPKPADVALPACSALTSASSGAPACAVAGVGVACRGEHRPCRSCFCDGCVGCAALVSLELQCKIAKFTQERRMRRENEQMRAPVAPLGFVGSGPLRWLRLHPPERSTTAQTHWDTRSFRL